MEYILVVAAIYNLLGAFAMWFQQTSVVETNNALSAE